MARLDYIKDTLQIVDFGAYALAKEIQIIQKENTNLSFVGLLRIYKIRADFVIMSKSNEYIYFPLSSAKIFLQSIGEPIDIYYGRTQIRNIINSIKNE